MVAMEPVRAVYQLPEREDVFVEPIDRESEALPARALEFRALLRAPVLFQAEQYQMLPTSALEDDAP